MWFSIIPILFSTFRRNFALLLATAVLVAIPYSTCFGQAPDWWTERGVIALPSTIDVSIEFEEGTTGDGTSHSFLPIEDEEASSGMALRSTPSTGENLSSRLLDAPKTSFSINIPAAGKYYVWFRLRGQNGYRDSIIYGLGSSLPTNQSQTVHVNREYGKWVWSNTNLNNGRTELTVSAAGQQTLCVWMREAGVEIDRIILTRSAAFVPTGATAGAPPASDFAAINQGQLKNLATAAAAEFDEHLDNGAGAAITNMVNAWKTPTGSTSDFAAVNLGQLKTVAKPFYDRLIASGIANGYPWSGAASDYAMANIGQAKNLFSFDPSTNSSGGGGGGIGYRHWAASQQSGYNTFPFDQAQERGWTLVNCTLELREWSWWGTLPPEAHDWVNWASEQLRARGLKGIWRANYSQPPSTSGNDPPLNIILAHIKDLGPTWRANADVIDALDVGHFGPWGEHNPNWAFGMSPDFWFDNPEGRKAIIDAVLAEFPGVVKTRYPFDKIYALGQTPSTHAQAQGTTARRLGFYLDAFSVAPSDRGWDHHIWRDGGYVTDYPAINNYLDEESKVVPVGVECPHFEYTVGWDYVMEYFGRHNVTNISGIWPVELFNAWKGEWRNGRSLYDEVDAKMGARLFTPEVYLSATRNSVAVGFKVENRGWARRHTEETVTVVIRNSGGSEVVNQETDWDFRDVPKDGSQLFTGSIPNLNLAPGSYSLHLRISDAHPAVASDPRYSFQLANSGNNNWNSTSGENYFGHFRVE